MKTKLSNLSYDIISRELGKNRFNMHYDASDALRTVSSEYGFSDVKNELISKYGDVEIEINKDKDWFDQIKIVDESWEKDYDKFCNLKASWCEKYGCN